MIEYYKILDLKPIYYKNDIGVTVLEVFKDIPNYKDHYQVSDLGRVKSLKSKKNIILKGADNQGYRYLVLRKNGIAKSYAVHKLVAITFIPMYEKHLVVDHIDNIQYNNTLSNLQIVTHRYNTTKDKTNKTNHINISLTKNNKYSVKLYYSKKWIYLGIFLTLEEATLKYKEALELINKNINPEVIKKEYKGKYLKGVDYANNKYCAKSWENGKNKYIGWYNTELEAHEAYLEYKKTKTNDTHKRDYI